MGNHEPGVGCGEGGRAGMAEEVQKFWGTGISMDFIVKQPLPLGGLLRKDAYVLESRRKPYLQGEGAKLNWPGFRYAAMGLPSIFLFMACVNAVPDLWCQGPCMVVGAGFLAHDREGAQALQLFAFSGVQELVVGPFGVWKCKWQNNFDAVG